MSMRKRPIQSSSSVISEQLGEERLRKVARKRQGLSRLECYYCHVSCWGESRAVALDLWYAHLYRVHWTRGSVLGRFLQEGGR